MFCYNIGGTENQNKWTLTKLHFMLFTSLIFSVSLKKFHIDIPNNVCAVGV